MYIAPILAVLLALTQQHEIQTHPEDPLHNFTLLEVGKIPAMIEVKVAHEGCLHVWATSKEIDPRLLVERGEGEEFLKDDNSGSGTTAYLEFSVHVGDVAKLTVAPSTDKKNGKVELHWIASVETDTTRLVASETRTRIKEAELLANKGDLEGAREMLTHALSILRKEKGAEMSNESCRAAWELGLSASRIDLIQTCFAAWMMRHDHCKRIFPDDHPDLLLTKYNLAITMWKAGDFSGARDLFAAVLEAYQRFLPEDHRVVLAAKGSLAGMMMEMGDLDGARALQESVVEVRSRTLPEDHPDLLTAKGNLALLMKKTGDLAGARAIEESVLEVRSRTLHEDHPDLLLIKENIAVTMLEMGDLDGARALFESVLEARSRTLPEHHPDLLSAKENLAITIYEIGDLSRARKLKEDVLEARSRTLPEDHPDLLLIKENLAITMREMGDLAGARPLQESVFEARSRILPEDHPDLIRAKGNLAGTMLAMGDLEGSYELFKSVLEAYQRIFPKDHPDLLWAKQYLADTMSLMGDLAGARALQESVLADYQRIFPEDHPDLLTAKANLADIMFSMGDYAGARALQESVFEARGRILPKDHPDFLATKESLAISMSYMGDLAGARMFQESVLEVRSRILPEDHPNLLCTKMNLAATMYQIGDIESTRALIEEVLKTRSRFLPEDHPNSLIAKGNLAITMCHMGDFSNARILQESVLEAFQSYLPDDHPDLLRTKGNLATTMCQMGDFHSCCKLAHELAENLLFKCSWAAASLSIREAQEIVASEHCRHSLVRVLTSFENAESSSAIRFNLAETLRSVASLDLGSYLDPNPEINNLRRRIADVRTRIGDFLGGSSTEGNLGETVADLVFERDKLERELRRKLTEKGYFVDAIQCDDVASLLKDGTVVIGFVQTEGWRVDENSHRLVRRGNILAAHVLRPDSYLFEVELGPSDELEELAATWRETLGKPIERGMSPPRKNEKQDEHTAGIALRMRILDPILAELEDDIHTLMICVDDFLHTIPLFALPLDEGRVGDRYELVYQPSFRWIVSPRPPLDTSDKTKLLVIGGINFDAKGESYKEKLLAVRSAAIESTDRSAIRPTHFRRLLQTRVEAELVSMLFEEVFEQEGIFLKEAEATKAAFTQLAPGNRYLHIATHGWFAPMVFPESSDENPAYSMLDVEELVSKLSPMILCGLAFAGANHGRDELGRVPGIMTAEELAGLDLSACELAVLSACETNVGIRSAGVGIQSLKAALHAAGVRTAITSLWKVDDAATRKLMELFYTYLWVDKMPKAKALWKAKMVLRDEGHPVRDWAAWVLSGDPD